MLIGRVIGNVVATKKNLKLDGEKLLLVQPLDLSGASKGTPIIAIDRMGAGPKERVLYTQDGRTAQQILGPGRRPRNCPGPRIRRRSAHPPAAGSPRR